MMKTSTLLLLLIFCSTFPLFVQASHAAESIAISCYSGDPGDDQYLGDVDSFSTSNASGICNSIYNDCQGNCTGCYIDEESEEVCMDSSGRRYTR